MSSLPSRRIQIRLQYTLAHLFSFLHCFLSEMCASKSILLPVYMYMYVVYVCVRYLAVSVGDCVSSRVVCSTITLGSQTHFKVTRILSWIWEHDTNSKGTLHIRLECNVWMNKHQTTWIVRMGLFVSGDRHKLVKQPFVAIILQRYFAKLISTTIPGIIIYLRYVFREDKTPSRV